MTCLTLSVLPEDSHTVRTFPMRKHGVRKQVSHGGLALGSGSLQSTLTRREVRYLAAFGQLPCRRQNCVTGFTHLHQGDNEKPLLLSSSWSSPAGLGRGSPSNSENTSGSSAFDVAELSPQIINSSSYCPIFWSANSETRFFVI